MDLVERIRAVLALEQDLGRLGIGRQRHVHHLEGGDLQAAVARLHRWVDEVARLGPAGGKDQGEGQDAMKLEAHGLPSK